MRPAASRRSPRGACRIDGNSGRSTSVTAAPASTTCAQAEPASRRALPDFAGAERPRHERADGDHQPDIDRDGEEQDDRRKPDAGGQRADRRARRCRAATGGRRRTWRRARPSPSPVITTTWRIVEPETKRGRRGPAMRVPARFRQAPARSSSPMMSRVSRDQAVRLCRRGAERLRLEARAVQEIGAAHDAFRPAA